MAITKRECCTARVAIYRYSEEATITLVDAKTQELVESYSFDLNTWKSEKNMFTEIKKVTDRLENTGTFRDYTNHTVVISGPFENLPPGVDLYDSPGFGEIQESEVISDCLQRVLMQRPLIIWAYDQSNVLVTEVEFFQFLMSNYPCTCGQHKCEKGGTFCNTAVPIFYLCNKCDRDELAMDTEFDDEDDEVDENEVLQKEESFCTVIRNKCYSSLVNSPVGTRVRGWSPSVADCPHFACLSTKDLHKDRSDFKKSGKRRPNFHYIDFISKFNEWVYNAEVKEIETCVSMIACTIRGVLDNLAGVSESYLVDIARQCEEVKKVVRDLKANVHQKVHPLFDELANDLCVVMASGNVRKELRVEATTIKLGDFDGSYIAMNNKARDKEARTMFAELFLAQVEKKCDTVYNNFYQKIDRAVSEAYTDTYKKNAELMANEMLNDAMYTKFNHSMKLKDDITDSSMFIAAGVGAVSAGSLSVSGYAAGMTNMTFVFAATGIALGAAALTIGAVLVVATIMGAKYDASWKEKLADTICTAIAEKKHLDVEEQTKLVTKACTKAFTDCENIANERVKALTEEFYQQDNNAHNNNADAIRLLGRIEGVCEALRSRSAEPFPIHTFSLEPVSRNAFSSVFKNSEGTAIRVPHCPEDISSLEVIL